MSIQGESELELGTVLENRSYRPKIGHNGGTKPINISAKIRTMDDHTLCQLITQIIESEDNSQEQKDLFNHLLANIPHLPGIYRVNDRNYDDALNEALGNIAGITRRKNNGGKHNLLSFAQKHKLNKPPEEVRENFVKWFNKILRNRLIEYWRKNKENYSLDGFLSAEQERTTFLEKQTYDSSLNPPTLSDLDFLIDEKTLNENRTIEQTLLALLEDEDFGSKEFREALKKHPKNYPTCTCGELFKRKEIEQQEWLEILTDLEVVDKNLTHKQLRETKAYKAITPCYSNSRKTIIEELRIELKKLNLL